MGERILIVEDDLLNRLFMAETLKAFGFEVDTVADGANAIAAVRAFRPHLVTMDINLPNVSGIELIEHLQADPETSETPVLAITAYVGKGEEARIRQAGAADYFAKPISIRPFIRSVRQLLDSASRSIETGLSKDPVK